MKDVRMFYDYRLEREDFVKLTWSTYVGDVALVDGKEAYYLFNGEPITYKMLCEYSKTAYAFHKLVEHYYETCCDTMRYKYLNNKGLTLIDVINRGPYYPCDLGLDNDEEERMAHITETISNFLETHVGDIIDIDRDGKYGIDYAVRLDDVELMISSISTNDKWTGIKKRLDEELCNPLNVKITYLSVGSDYSKQRNVLRIDFCIK